jgi:cell shape-determining protein MreD
MNILFYTGLSLILVILKTTLMPYFSMFDQFYDLLIPFVFYLGLYRPAREGIPFILLLGFTLDSLSGGPFGIFLTTYFWLFVLTRWFVTFLHAGNKGLWLIAVAAGVLIENLIIIATIFWLGEASALPPGWDDRVVTQLLWALCTGPVWIIVISMAHRKWSGWVGRIAAGLKEQETG